MANGFLQRISDRWLMRRDPTAFVRSLGVQIGGSVRFYGVSREMFGSEPWALTIGNNVYVTAGVQFLTHDGGTLILRQKVPDLEWTAPITIGNDVYIGVRSIILPGVEVGDGVVIGAGSVVTKSIPSRSVVAGNPARVIRTLDDYLSRLEAKSLHLGHLHGDEKDRALRAHFGVE